MAKYIDVEAINWYDDLFMKGKNDSGVWVRYRDVEKLIRDAPPADVRPVVRGRWIVSHDSDSYQLLQCDHCNSMMWNHEKELPNFCYNCGADMRPERRADNG